MSESQPEQLEPNFVYQFNPTDKVVNDSFKICFRGGVLYWRHVPNYIGFTLDFSSINTAGINYNFQGNDDYYQVEYLYGNTLENHLKYHLRENESIEGFNQQVLETGSDLIILSTEKSSLRLRKNILREL
ncbi:hypothetical protein ACTFIZ_010572 [Dictyostelium cf. discoideum]